ncbi:MAG: hypothetical protein IPM95_12770 [Sphingobacteriales bacterium]|jgi:hypothetical protein|nr:hypothetical protein [Sphingobacteriales bacterium]
MKKKALFYTFFLWVFFQYKFAAAQEENYQPTQIIEPLDNKKSSEKGEKPKTAREDVKSAAELKKERLNRLRVGLGNFGLQFGAFTYINVTPTVGYMVIKDRLELGAGPILIYERIRYSSSTVLSFFVYGSDIYAKGYIYKGLNLEARYDFVNKPSNFYYDRRVNVHHLLLGAGYAAPIGKIGVFNASLLFNVLNNKESIYRGTFGNFPMILNLGFGFGLGGKN